MRVKAKFDDDKWYPGDVKGVDGGRIRIEFDDGEETVENADDEGVCVMEPFYDMARRKQEQEERRADEVLKKQVSCRARKARTIDISFLSNAANTRASLVAARGADRASQGGPQGRRGEGR